MSLPFIITHRVLRNSDSLPQDAGCWKNCTCYCHATGNQTLTLSSNVVGRDRYDDFYESLTDGDGLPHTPPRLLFKQQCENGSVTRLCEPFVAYDAITDSVFRMGIYGTYHDDANDYGGQTSFFENMRLLCWRSVDGGQTFAPPLNLTEIYLKQYSDGRPLISCSHLLSCRDGRLRIPCGIYKPGWTSWRCRVLIGTPGTDAIDWKWGNEIQPMPEHNYFMSEFSIAEVPDGLFAIVRADDLDNPTRCRKLMALSQDGGLTWSPTREVMYTDGSTFHCSDSCGFLLRHSTGRLFYICNIFEKDMPPINARISLSIIEVDDKLLSMKKETLMQIDGLQGNDNPELAISNFTCYEDRRNGDIVIEAPKMFQHTSVLHDSTLMEYRVNVQQ